MKKVSKPVDLSGKFYSPHPVLPARAEMRCYLRHRDYHAPDNTVLLDFSQIRMHTA